MENLLDKKLLFSEVEEFPVVPEGIYDAISVSIDPYVSSSGNECAWWRFKIVGDNEYAGQLVSMNVNLPVAGSSKEWLRKCWKFKTTLRALGVDLKDRTLREVIESVKGLRCKIEVLTDVYAGSERSYVNSVISEKEAPKLPF